MKTLYTYSLLLFIFAQILSYSDCYNPKGNRVYKSKLNSTGNAVKKRDYSSSATSRAMSSSSSSGSLSSSSDFQDQDHGAEESSIDEQIVNNWVSSGHRGGSSKYSSSSLPSVAPRYSSEKYSSQNSIQQQPLYSSYPYGSYSNYHSYYNNPLMDTYPYYERERAARELTSRVSPLPSISPSMAAAASSLFGSVAPPFDLDAYGDALALASGHGWGWKEKEHDTHDHINHYVSKVNTNAIGLLGLLGLLSLLSNVLLLLTTTTTTTTTAAGRRKRSIQKIDEEESNESKMKRIFEQAIPFLAPIAHARNGQIPVECTFQGVCLTNKLLVKEFGIYGRPAGSRITSAVVKLLGEIGTEENYKKKIELAGLDGRNSKDCHKAHPVCKVMELRPHQASMPFVIKMEDVPKLLEKFRKVSSYNPMQL